MTPDQRALWDADIARSRQALGYWRENAPEMHSPTTAARVAAAEQLQECEDALYELGRDLHNHLPFDSPLAKFWQARIAALGLGP